MGTLRASLQFFGCGDVISLRFWRRLPGLLWPVCWPGRFKRLVRTAGSVRFRRLMIKAVGRPGNRMIRVGAAITAVEMDTGRAAGVVETSRGTANSGLVGRSPLLMLLLGR
jgi:hypothetical protein